MGLSCGVVCVILSLAVLIQYRSVTHTHTRRHTTTAYTALSKASRGKKLGSRLSLMESAICNVAQDIHNIRSKIDSLETGAQSLQLPTSSFQLTDCPIASTSASQLVNTTVELITLGNSETATTGLVNESADHDAGRATEMSSQRTNWAFLVSMPLIQQPIWCIRHDR